MKRTPTPEDAETLRYAGLMGHRFVLVSGEIGERRIRSEQNDTEIRVGGVYGSPVDPRVYEQIRFKSRRGRRWRRAR